MNEDTIKKANKLFEERSGAKVPPPPRSTRASAQAPQEDARTDVPEHDPPALSHKATGRSPNRFAMICVPLLPCGPK